MKKQNDFHATVRNLMLLDPESLLLIDSGVKLLLARQGMVKKAEEKTGSAGKSRQWFERKGISNE